MSINNISIKIPIGPAAGQISYGARGTVRVFDGTYWVELHSMMPAASQERKYTDDELCKLHPGLEQLKKEVKEAQERYDAYLALVKE